MGHLKDSCREGLGKQGLNEGRNSSRILQDDDAARKRQSHGDLPTSTGHHTQVTPDMPNLMKKIPSKRACMLPVTPVPTVQEASLTSGVILKGTANISAGPPVGSVDIGISESAYYFCVSLPGVKKDPGEFSCLVEHKGRVRIRGVTTTGATTVTRCSRVYAMKLQQQCVPGPFTLSFNLPGPVDPRLFSPSFRSDGIFEGIVLKSD